MKLISLRIDINNLKRTVLIICFINYIIGKYYNHMHSNVTIGWSNFQYFFQITFWEEKCYNSRKFWEKYVWVERLIIY